MRKLLIVNAVLVLGVVLTAQVSGPSQITLKPIAAASGCLNDASGDVLCGASDGFYISVAGGAFEKIVAGSIPAPPSPTSITCTTASLSSGASGTFTASGCTLK